MRNLAVLAIAVVVCHHSLYGLKFREQNLNNSQLIEKINEVIAAKCHLTKLSSGESVLCTNESIEVKIDFDNRTLRSFWTPEVAVQYIFDAALDPIMALAFNKLTSQKVPLRKVVFYVHIAPHDIPPMLVFKTYQVDYLNYKKGIISKATFFRKMNITAGGIIYRFDAEKAVNIE